MASGLALLDLSPGLHHRIFRGHLGQAKFLRLGPFVRRVRKQ